MIPSYATPDWCWQLRWEPYEKMGEIFITVSPGRNITWVTNAEAILQITQRRENFPKPLEAYKVLDVFGPNVISTDGTEWRMHRKATSPGFNEKNNALVFKESIAQAQGMLRKWISDGQISSKTINSVPEDTMRLGLHIISRIGFGVRLFWPGEGPSEEEKASDSELTCHEKENGHTMSFETALTTLIDKMFVILLTPEWILSKSALSYASIS
jgi:cytochrome P450